jgi:hypothetical protein
LNVEFEFDSGRAEPGFLHDGSEHLRLLFFCETPVRARQHTKRLHQIVCDRALPVRLDPLVQGRPQLRETLASASIWLFFTTYARLRIAGSYARRYLPGCR